MTTDIPHYVRLLIMILFFLFFLFFEQRYYHNIPKLCVPFTSWWYLNSRFALKFSRFCQVWWVCFKTLWPSYMLRGLEKCFASFWLWVWGFFVVCICIQWLDSLVFLDVWGMWDFIMGLADIMVYGCSFQTKDFNGVKKFVSNKQNPSGVLKKKRILQGKNSLLVQFYLFRVLDEWPMENVYLHETIHGSSKPSSTNLS